MTTRLLLALAVMGTMAQAGITQTKPMPKPAPPLTDCTKLQDGGLLCTPKADIPKPDAKQVTPPVKPDLFDLITPGFIATASVFGPPPGPCGWMGTWDAGKGVCAIHVHFGSSGDLPPITCSPVAAAEGKQYMICWYRPVPPVKDGK